MERLRGNSMPPKYVLAAAWFPESFYGIVDLGPETVGRSAAIVTHTREERFVEVHRSFSLPLREIQCGLIETETPYVDPGDSAKRPMLGRWVRTRSQNVLPVPGRLLPN